MKLSNVHEILATMPAARLKILVANIAKRPGMTRAEAEDEIEKHLMADPSLMWEFFAPFSNKAFSRAFGEEIIFAEAPKPRHLTDATIRRREACAQRQRDRREQLRVLEEKRMALQWGDCRKMAELINRAVSWYRDVVLYDGTPLMLGTKEKLAEESRRDRQSSEDSARQSRFYKRLSDLVPAGGATLEASVNTETIVSIRDEIFSALPPSGS